MQRFQRSTTCGRRLRTKSAHISHPSFKSVTKKPLGNSQFSFDTIMCFGIVYSNIPKIIGKTGTYRTHNEPRGNSVYKGVLTRC